MNGASLTDSRRAAKAQGSTLLIGLAVHTESLAVASGSEEREAEGVFLGTLGTRQCDSDKLMRKLQVKGKKLPCVYETTVRTGHIYGGSVA